MGALLKKRGVLLVSPSLSGLLTTTAGRLDVDETEIDFRDTGAGFHEAWRKHPDGSANNIGVIFPPRYSLTEQYELWLALTEEKA